MNRELIQKVEELLPAVEGWDEYKRVNTVIAKNKGELAELEKEVKQFLKNFLIYLLMGYVAGGVLSLPLELLEFAGILPAPIAKVVVYLIQIIIPIGYAFWEKVTTKNKLDKKQKEQAILLEQFERMKEEVPRWARRICAVIPEKYADSWSVGMIHSYLVNSDAETLEEAFRLCDEEKRRKEEREKQEQELQVQESQKQEK